MTVKTAKKTARPSPRSGVSLPVGNHPGNTGGKKGRSGRPPRKLKEMLAKLRMDTRAQLALIKAARDSENPSFRTAWTIATSYDEEAPAKRVEHSGTIKMRHEEAEARFAEIVGIVNSRREAIPVS
jgi:hypothetical protein